MRNKHNLKVLEAGIDDHRNEVSTGNEVTGFRDKIYHPIYS